MIIYTKKFLFTFLIIILFGCDNDKELRQTKVNYNKPYLTSDFKGKDKDKARVMMHDYDTKESVDVNTFDFKIVEKGSYNKYSKDYLYIDHFVCEILVVHRDSTSEIFDPCKLSGIKNAGSQDGIFFSDKYILVQYNIGYIGNNELTDNFKNYGYGLGVFTKNYQLVDSFIVDGYARPAILDGDKIIYCFTQEDINDNPNETFLVTYNFLKKKEEKRVHLKYGEVHFLAKYNNRILVGANNHKVYENDKVIFDNGENMLLIDTIYQYRNNLGEVVLPSNSYKASFEGESKLLIIKENSLYLKDDFECDDYLRSYTSQGQYCKSVRDGRIIFQDFKENPKILDLKVGEGKDEYLTYDFFDWK